jgi:hypothetical protein
MGFGKEHYMQSHSPSKLWVKLGIVCSLTVAAGLFTFRAQADPWDKTTILKIDQPIQITDTYLDPGTYVLKLANTSDRHVVQIYNADQSHIINTILAIPNYRLQPTGDSHFMFWETPPGSAQALRAWFYPGDNFGQEFRYPKQLRQIASLKMPEPIFAPEPPAPENEESTPAMEPVPQAMNQAPSPEETPVEIAQNAAPPAPEPAPQAAPTPVPAAMPEQLPKTSTPYPAMGLGGLFSLGMYGLVRYLRPA